MPIYITYSDNENSVNGDWRMTFNYIYYQFVIQRIYVYLWASKRRENNFANAYCG